MTLAWTPDALRDRRAIYDYLEAHNPRAALHLDELIVGKVGRLVHHPETGRRGRVEGTRELVVHRHYVVVYDRVEETVTGRGRRECPALRSGRGN